MAIEWQVRGVDGEPVCETGREALVRCTGDGSGAAPEKSVMHKQQIGAGRDRAVDREAGSIDGRRHSRHWTGALHLQTVECAGIVGDFAHAQRFIEMLHDASERDAGHEEALIVQWSR